MRLPAHKALQQLLPTTVGMQVGTGHVPVLKRDDIEQRPLANAPAAKRRQETTVRIVVSFLSSVCSVPLQRPALEFFMEHKTQRSAADGVAGPDGNLCKSRRPAAARLGAPRASAKVTRLLLDVAAAAVLHLPRAVGLRDGEIGRNHLEGLEARQRGAP